MSAGQLNKGELGVMSGELIAFLKFPKGLPSLVDIHRGFELMFPNQAFFC